MRATETSPTDNLTETDVVRSARPQPPAAPLPPMEGFFPMPLVLTAWTEDGTLPRSTSTATVALAHFPSSSSGGILEVFLETGGTKVSLGEFDIQANREGTASSVRFRLRAPADAPAGPAQLAFVVKDLPGVARVTRPAVRVAVTGSSGRGDGALGPGARLRGIRVQKRGWPPDLGEGRL